MPKPVNKIHFIAAIFLLLALVHDGVTLAEQSELLPLTDAEAEDILKRTKIPTIDASALGLLRPLTERVWLTKYYGRVSEIYQTSGAVPFCHAWPAGENPQLPNNQTDQEVSLWRYGCTPVEVEAQKVGDGEGGRVIVRMLDFGQSEAVLRQVFDVIKADRLGTYEISAEEISVLQRDIYKADDDAAVHGHKFFRTYARLERYLFSQKNRAARAIDAAMAYRARKYALTLDLSSVRVEKDGDIVSYTFAASAGFFGFGLQSKTWQ